MEYYRSQVLICTGTGCSSSNSPAIIKRFEECIRNAGLENEIKVVRTGCFGLCENGPICIVYPEGAFYSHIKVDDVERIVSEHLVKGRVVADLLYKKSVTEDGKIRSLEEIDFYKKQKRVALSNCGVIDPENIDEYISIPKHIKADFALTCKGDSMINARIWDGDTVYIKQQDTVENGEIAAVLIDNEATLKRVRLFKDHIILEPENPMYKPFVYWHEEMNKVRILGKAVAFTSAVR